MDGEHADYAELRASSGVTPAGLEFGHMTYKRLMKVITSTFRLELLDRQLAGMIMDLVLALS